MYPVIDELLPPLGLELQPVARAPPRLVRRVGSLGHDPLEALLLRRRVQRRAVVERGGDLDPALPRVDKLREPLSPLGERQVDHRRPLHLEQVERDVEVGRAFLALLHRRERRPAVLTNGHNLPVEDAVGRPERALERADNRREAIDERLVVPAAQVDVAAPDRRDRPKAVPLDLEEPPLTGRHLGREGRQHRPVGPRLPRGRGVLLLLPDDQPVLRVAAEMCRHERPDPVELLAAQADRETAVRLLLDELVGAVIPDLDRPRAVVAGRDLARERGVGERVILDVDRKMLLSGLHAGRLSAPPSSQALHPARAGSRSADAAHRGAEPRRSAPCSCAAVPAYCVRRARAFSPVTAFARSPSATPRAALLLARAFHPVQISFWRPQDR